MILPETSQREDAPLRLSITDYSFPAWVIRQIPLRPHFLFSTSTKLRKEFRKDDYESLHHWDVRKLHVRHPTGPCNIENSALKLGPTLDCEYIVWKLLSSPCPGLLRPVIKLTSCLNKADLWTAQTQMIVCVTKTGYYKKIPLYVSQLKLSSLILMLIA